MSPAKPAFWIAADWPAPDWIKAGTTTHAAGFSLPPYAGLNLAQHVGDDYETVEQNRQCLQTALDLPSAPLWLNQVHGSGLIDSQQWSANVIADAAYTTQRDIVCVILSADCLPLLLCDIDGGQIAAVHLGWRGLCSPLLENVVHRFAKSGEQLLAWIGPHIHANNYEVGEEVRLACVTACPGTDHAFSPGVDGKCQASLQALVRHKLGNLGISKIYANDTCTFAEQDKFYSYRRQNTTGRMASLIWMETVANSTML